MISSEDLHLEIIGKEGSEIHDLDKRKGPKGYQGMKKFFIRDSKRGFASDGHKGVGRCIPVDDSLNHD
jgi:hypothetical protein